MSPMNNRLLVPKKTPGLLDLVPGAAAAYSLRSLSRSYADPVVTVRRSSDDAEDSFTAAEVADGTLAAFCGAGDGFVKTWHSQTGSNDATQTTAGYQPKIVSSGVVILEEGKPALRFDGSDDYLDAVGYKPSGAVGLFSVFTYASFSNVGLTLSCGKTSTPSGGFQVFNYNTAPATIGFQTGLGGVWVDGVNELDLGDYDLNTTIVSFQATSSGTTMHVRFVSVLDSPKGLIAPGNDLRIGGNIAGASLFPFDGTFSELIIYPSDQSANRQRIEGDLAWYY